MIIHLLAGSRPLPSSTKISPETDAISASIKSPLTARTTFLFSKSISEPGSAKVVAMVLKSLICGVDEIAG